MIFHILFIITLIIGHFKYYTVQFRVVARAFLVPGVDIWQSGASIVTTRAREGLRTQA